MCRSELLNERQVRRAEKQLCRYLHSARGQSSIFQLENTLIHLPEMPLTDKFI